MKALQIHIPKTGGTSVSRALKKQGVLNLGHSPLHFKVAQKTIKDYDYLFTFLRNPLDRAVSLYSFFVKERGRLIASKISSKTKREIPFTVKFAHLDINDFWREVCKLNLFNAPLFRPQTYWVQGFENEINYYSFTNLQSEFDRLCSDIGVETEKLEHMRKSDRCEWQEELEEDVQKLIKEYYKEDYLLLDRHGIKTN